MNRLVWIWGGVILLGVGLMVALLASSGEKATTKQKEAGLQTTTAPWEVEYAHLSERLAGLAAQGFPATPGTEQFHIHQHLDMDLDGKKVKVPANVGFDRAAGVASPLHTHDETGVIHVESDEPFEPTLGDFFTIWGVKHSADSLGAYKADGAKKLKLYVNGVEQSGDWQGYKLKAHDELYLFYGLKDAAPTVPTRYEFPPGE